MTNAQKGAETRRQRAQAERERFRARLHDCEAALALCRTVRDDEAADYETRLWAVALLRELTGGGTHG